MAPEKANKVNKIIAILSSGALTLVTFIWLAGGFYTTTKATNEDFSKHVDEDKQIHNEQNAFQTHALVKIESLTVSVNYLAKEIEKKNALDEKYHKYHKD